MRKEEAACERRSQQGSAVQEMEEGADGPLPGPPGSTLRERDSKPLQGAPVKSRGLERCRKRQGNPCQVCTTELSESEPSMTRRKVENRHQNRGRGPSLGQAWRGYLALGQAVSGVKGARTSCGLLYGTREPVVSSSRQKWREREYAEAESRRREYRIRRTGADCGVVAMKGL